MLNRKREIAAEHSREMARERETFMTTPKGPRRYPIGAEFLGAKEAHFRGWAPKAHNVDLVLEESAEKNAKRTFHPLQAEESGYFSGSANVGADALYRFRINNAEHFHPDPPSRFHPHAPQ